MAAERERYLKPEEANTVLEACPDVRWRVLVGLARFGGLRCPSETHILTWADIDWDRGRMTVRSPKTERFEQHRQRVVPIGPKLRPLLQDAFHAAEDGQEGVVGLSRNNMRRQTQVILKRAGLEPFGRCFQVFRQGCETEWAMTLPQHAVSAWMGHSEAVSRKHYLQVPDEIFDRAAGHDPANPKHCICAAASSRIGSRGLATDTSATSASHQENTTNTASRAPNSDAPGGTRTHDRRIRNPMLYPPELPAPRPTLIARTVGLGKAGRPSALSGSRVVRDASRRGGLVLERAATGPRGWDTAVEPWRVNSYLLSMTPSMTPLAPQPLRATFSECLRDQDTIVGWINEVTGRAEADVRRRLRAEFRSPGSTVTCALRESGVERYVWSDALARFYERTDAFLYELVIWNLNRIKGWMRRAVARHLNRENGRGLDVLNIGDGLGFDSVYLAQAGHRMTYFELPGCTEAFARRVFADGAPAVSVVTDPAHLTAGRYDAVVCLDVLEHVPDPPAFVKTIADYLRPGGRLIVNAPFMVIHPTTATHLKSNRKYSGCLKLYERHGFRLIDGEIGWNPIVLRKVGSDQRDGSLMSPKLLALRVAGCVLAMGRAPILPLDLADGFRRLLGQWFDE